MSFFIRNCGKYFSKNVIREKCGQFLSFNLKRTNASFTDLNVPNIHNTCHNHITSKYLMNNTSRNKKFGRIVFLTAGIFNFFGFKKEDPEEEPELITVIKRGVLLIQNGDFKKAEQMLHIALKLAQEQQNSDGITYIYDLLANLAFEIKEFDKAEKLYKSVLQRLLSNGVPKDDNKIVHISLKLADIYRVENENSKAEEGYKFCATSLQQKIEKGNSDEDTLLLWAMTLDWYAKFLVGMNRLPEAFDYFKKAYDLCIRLNGINNEETVVLLNDLGTICFVQDDFDKAITYFSQAVAIGSNLPDMRDYCSVLINLGTVYMKKGRLGEAKKFFKEAWSNAKKHHNDEVLREASSCLDELKLLETA